MTEYALNKGDAVVAASRPSSAPALNGLLAKHSPKSLVVVPFDLLKPETITAAFARAKEVFGRIDVVFNNAGITTGGEIESTTDESTRKVFETNFFGALIVNKEAVRQFRDGNPAGVGGTLMIVSSYLGGAPMPCVGIYSASKAGESGHEMFRHHVLPYATAIEAVTQAMAGEIDPAWNIKVCLTLQEQQPCSMHTDNYPSTGKVPHASR